jgi:uncharacterized membrane protein
LQKQRRKRLQAGLGIHSLAFGDLRTSIYQALLIRPLLNRNVVRNARINDGKMSRPKVKLLTTGTDWVFEGIGLLGIILTVTYVIANYSNLPDTLPSHYNLAGQPDGFGGKAILFGLLSIAIATYLIMTIGVRFPHMFNYPFKITDENAERQYKNMSMMIRILKTLVVVIFLYLTFVTIQNGLGKMNGLGTWFVPVTIFTLFGIVGFYLYKGFRLR